MYGLRSGSSNGGSRRTRAIAHRGLSALHPENSLEAFEAALKHVDVLEVDVRATSDGVLVCTHDQSLDRTHSVGSKVGTLTWSELRMLAPPVPRLEDVLGSFGSRAGWFLDCKVARPRVIESLIETIARCGLSWDSGEALRAGEGPSPGTVAFEHPDGELLQSFRARTGAGCVELVRGHSSSRELVFTAPFMAAYAHGVVLPERLATRRTLRYLSALRLGTYVYTVNDQSRFDQLSSAGADGVFTDDVSAIG